MFCTNCGKEIDDNAYVCIHCGVKTDVQMPVIKQEEHKYCTNCGKQIDPNAYICVYCGVKTDFGDRAVSQHKAKSNSDFVFAILSMIMTLITLTYLGAIFAVVGMTKSLVAHDKKGIRINLIAIAVCVLFSIAIIAIGLA